MHFRQTSPKIRTENVASHRAGRVHPLSPRAPVLALPAPRPLRACEVVTGAGGARERGLTPRGGATLKCSISYPPASLTGPGRSHTLSVLLVRRDGPSDRGPLYGAFGVGIGGLL